MATLTDLNNLYLGYEHDSSFNHMVAAGRNFVPGHGPLQAPLMLIGEAPGKMENAKMTPFVGKAGANLVNLLEEVGIRKDEVFRTNVVKYWPLPQADGSYTPTQQEIEDSRDYVLEEIKIVDPVIVGLCGRIAINVIFPEVKRVADQHAQLLLGNFVPLYHPALISYQPWRREVVKYGYHKLKAYLDAKAAA